MMTRTFFGLALTLLALLAAEPASAQFQVVVHAGADVSEISSDDLSRIFQKKSRSLPDGTDAVPVELEPASSVRAAFSDAVHGRGVSAIEAYWQQQIFSGRDVPPETFASDAALLEYVASTPGAIGYVSSGASLPSGVKAVAVN